MLTMLLPPLDSMMQNLRLCSNESVSNIYEFWLRHYHKALVQCQKAKARITTGWNRGSLGKFAKTTSEYLLVLRQQCFFRRLSSFLDSARRHCRLALSSQNEWIWRMLLLVSSWNEVFSEAYLLNEACATTLALTTTSHCEILVSECSKCDKVFVGEQALRTICETVSAWWRRNILICFYNNISKLSTTTFRLASLPPRNLADILQLIWYEIAVLSRHHTKNTEQNRRCCHWCRTGAGIYHAQMFVNEYVKCIPM